MKLTREFPEITREQAEADVEKLSAQWHANESPEVRAEIYRQVIACWLRYEYQPLWFSPCLKVHTQTCAEATFPGWTSRVPLA